MQPQPTQQVVYQQKPAAAQPQILRTANGQQVFSSLDFPLTSFSAAPGAGQRWRGRPTNDGPAGAAKAKTPSPANSNSSVDGRPAAGSRPDARRETANLCASGKPRHARSTCAARRPNYATGNNGLKSTRTNSLSKIVQAGVQQQAGTQLIMTSGGLKQVVQAQPAPQRTIQPHPAATTRIVQRQVTPPAAAAAPAPTPATTESESLMPNEELNGIDSEHTLGTEAGIEDTPVDPALESSESAPVDDPPVHEEVVQEEIVQEEIVQEEIVQENLENLESKSEPTE